MSDASPRHFDAPRAQPSEPLRRFLQVARGAGLRVSAAEGIDAARAVDLVGYHDRTLLKDTLALVLAKTPEEKALYDEAFELYFRRAEFAKAASLDNAEAPAHAGQAGAADRADETGSSGPAPLLQLLDSDDRATLASALESAARAIGIEKIRLFTQKNLYIRQILDRMGLREVEAQIAALRASGGADDDERAQRLSARLERLRDAARDHVERALLLYGRAETEQLRERMLKSARLANIDPSQHERIRVLVRKMAKRIATRYAIQRRKRQRGQLDVRRTLRRNMGWGGVPFVTAWKQRRIEKPRVMVLCDVSGSVAWVAQFLLMFIYALTEVLSDIRSFVYTSSLIEVSEILERNGIDAAIAQVTDTMAFGTSNYGTSLEDFEAGWMREVTSKTTVIILGDARGNDTDPRTDIVERLAQRAKRIVWLNPEPRSAWGSGDSDMYRYAPYCTPARVCSTLNDLERVITDLLDRAR
ncbi:MAG: VWA domain-containing protein [Burkholderiales bacterium]|nr:VWA domain-containing protein [Burkholderiales bacterium]